MPAQPPNSQPPSPPSAADSPQALNKEKSNAELLRKGIYRHFKGQLYQVIDVAQHCDTEEYLVVYRALYGERGLWVRPLANFVEIVERDGTRTPRFQWQAPE